ncbi:cache domain-containing sensor histidine kinase [Metabacillus arenae]|nr:sensor histidine kinase [Metabacillus arenae]
MTNYIEKLNEVSLSIYEDSNMSPYISNRTFDLTYEKQQSIKESMLSIFQKDAHIHQVYFSSKLQNRAFLLTNNLGFNTSSIMYDYPKPSIESDYTPFLELPHGNHAYSTNAYIQHGNTVMTLHRPLYRVPSSELIGWLAIDFELDNFLDILQNLYFQGEEEIFIYDLHANQLVYPIQPNNTKLNVLRSDWVDAINQSENDTWAISIDEDLFSGVMIFSKVQTQLQNWVLIKRIPKETLYQNLNNIAQINRLIMFASLVIAIILVLYVSISITTPLKKLTNHIEKVEKGQMYEYVNMNIDSKDEVGILTKKFQEMMDTINDLIINKYKQELINTRTKLKMLQAQINPHFLNNSLQSIGAAALEKGDYKVYSLISSLGQLMHYSMETENMYVTLKEEFNYITYYINLQKQRFGSLDVDMKIEDSIKDIKVPKMLLQPIVENYFKYGYEPSQTNNMLKVSAITSDGKLIIKVLDNGKGLNEADLLSLKTSINKSLSSSEEELQNKIGLLNVIKRAVLFWGKGAKIQIDSNEFGGLNVELHIPLGSDVSESYYRR